VRLPGDLAMADCATTEELISGYLDGELTGGEMREVKAHLAVCDACRQALSEMRAVSGALAGEEVEPPEGFRASIMKRIESAEGCREVADLLPLAADGGLDPSAEDRVEAHVAECPACRVGLRRYQALLGCVKSLEPQLPPESLRKNIIAATCARQRAGRGVFASRRLAWAGGLAAACVLMAAGFGLVLHHPGVEKAPRASRPAVSAPVEMGKISESAASVSPRAEGVVANVLDASRARRTPARRSASGLRVMRRHHAAQARIARLQVVPPVSHVAADTVSGAEVPVQPAPVPPPAVPAPPAETVVQSSGKIVVVRAMPERVAQEDAGSAALATQRMREIIRSRDKRVIYDARSEMPMGKRVAVTFWSASF